MDYQDCAQLLEELGVEAPIRPGNRSRTLRWADGACIRGIYLNATAAGLAYFTLNTACKLEVDVTLWRNLPGQDVKLQDRRHRNILPRAGREREALRSLLAGPG